MISNQVSKWRELFQQTINEKVGEIKMNYPNYSTDSGVTLPGLHTSPITLITLMTL